MKKLHQLKSWLTLEDTAKRLSIMLNEQISPADIVQLVMDKHLKLSVNLINGEFAKIVNVIPIEQVVELSQGFFVHNPSDGEEKLYKNVKIDKDIVFGISPLDKVTVIHGIFDLIILDSTVMEIERLYHKLSNTGIEIELVDSEIFLESENGQLYQLQRRWDEDHHKFLNADTPIRLDDETVVSYSEFLDLTPKKHFFDPSDYNPAYKIPLNSYFLIRKINIELFMKTLEKKEQPVEKPKYTHSSELMQIMDEAIVEFWENHDPKNPPNSEAIKQWIKENNKNLSGREATAIDLIMRPLRYK